MNIDQTYRIKKLLAEHGETITSMARKIDRPCGSVASNIYGYRINRDLQEKIAEFLGLPAEDLFGGNGREEAT